MKLLWPVMILAAGACSQPSGQSSGGQGSGQGGEGGSAPIAAPYAAQEEVGNTSTSREEPAVPRESACRVQDKTVLSNQAIKVVGTEPFWGARIDGRCVTYSTPDNQAGTRVWTRYTEGPDGGLWTGAYEGKPFELRTRAVKSCSDGMSDIVYPIEAQLKVGGEDLRGCAAPL